MLVGSTVSILDRVEEGATESFPWMSRCCTSMDRFHSSGRGKPVLELQPDTQNPHDSGASEIRLRRLDGVLGLRGDRCEAMLRGFVGGVWINSRFVVVLSR